MEKLLIPLLYKSSPSDLVKTIYQLQNQLFNYEAVCFDAISAEGYFVCVGHLKHKSQLLIHTQAGNNWVTQAQCQFVNCQLLKKYNLMLGYVEVNTLKTGKLIDNYAVNLKSLRIKIVTLYTLWLGLFYQRVKLHLKTKQVFKMDVCEQKTIMQKALLEARAGLTYCAYSLAQKVTDELLLTLFAKLTNISRALTKLFGGKAFLPGQLLEISMLFHFLRDIYFY